MNNHEVHHTKATQLVNRLGKEQASRQCHEHLSKAEIKIITPKGRRDWKFWDRVLDRVNEISS